MSLQYFVGKACTILAGPINRGSFTEGQLQDYFVGIVEVITERGVWTKHPVTGCKNYYPMRNIIGICEEQVVSDPKIIEKYKEAKKEIAAKTHPAVEESPFIDTDMMRELSRQAKQLSQKTATL